MSFQKQSEEQILKWITAQQMDLLGKYLVSGSIHGKPGVPVAELGRIEKIIAKNLTFKEQYLLGKLLLQRSEYTARNIASHLIAKGWPDHRDVEKLMKLAANDDDWIVREYAAGAFAELLAKDFSHFSRLFAEWAKTESVNTKRAIALAIKYDSKGVDAKKWKTYFSIIDPLMSEEAEYIRKNLGPFAIGDGLLGRFPEQVLKACEKWSRSENENVRWNTAMIFTAAAARRFPAPGKKILKNLMEDPSLFVKKAALKAFRNLGG